MRYAGFWMRMWAFLLDSIVAWALGNLVWNVFHTISDVPKTDGMFAPHTMMMTVVYFGYFVAMTAQFQATIGKMVFGLKVVTLEGTPLSAQQLLFREVIGRYICLKTVLLGFVLVAFMKRKTGLHDLFVDTTVVHE